MSFYESDREFRKKYNAQITGIALKNGVDMGVATDMFKSNLLNTQMGTITKDNVYQGGGVVQEKEWNEITNDYIDLKNKAVEEVIKGGGSTPVLGFDIEGVKKK